MYDSKENREGQFTTIPVPVFSLRFFRVHALSQEVLVILTPSYDAPSAPDTIALLVLVYLLHDQIILFLLINRQNHTVYGVYGLG